MNKLTRYFFFLIIFVYTLLGCTRNPLGEQIFQPIIGANFILSQSCVVSLTQDTPYSCQIVSSDNSAPITWSLANTSTCAWATIDSATGIVSGTPLDAHVGSCNLVIGATQGAISALPLTVGLTIANVAPTLTITNATSINEDSIATLIKTDLQVQASEEGDGVYSFDHSTTTVARCIDHAQGLTIDPNTGAITYNPAADYYGTCQIKVVFNDQTGTANATVASEFSITVNPINDAPVLSAISNYTISENSSLNVNFSFSDVDDAVTCSSANLNFTSSNTGLIDPATISFSGTGPSCTATITPASNQSGLANLTLTGSDGVLTAVRSFSVTVNPTNDAPTIAPIASQATPEDTAINVPFFISDPDSVITCTSANVSVTSSNLGLVPVANVVLSGAIPNCIAAITPVANANGVTNIQLTVHDNGSPNLQASASFALTVSSVNDAPTITSIVNQTTNEDTSIGVNFTINDVDNPMSCTTAMSASTSDPSLLPMGGIAFSGTAPNCTVTLTPVANNSGSVNLVLTVSDGLLNNTSAFTLTVNPVNDVPTMTAIANQTIAEDTATGSLAFTIGDVDSILSCAGSVTATSSNTAIIPNGSINIGGVAPFCTIDITPFANVSGGPVNITLTLTDAGAPLPAMVVQTSFTVTVTPVNDGPSLTSIANQTINEDTSTGAIPFTIFDSDSTLTCGSVVGTSSNNSLIANAGIVISGTAPNCLVNVTPLANLSGGPVDITLTLTDNGTPLPALTAAQTFQVTVNTVNDAPTISSITNQTVNEDGSVVVNFTINDVDNILNCSGASLSASSSDTTLQPVASIVFGGAAPACTATITPTAGLSGTSNLGITVTDGALTNSSNFTLTVNAVNDAPSLTIPASQTISEDTSTIAIPFTISDTDSTVACNTSVTVSSSNTAIIPVSGIVIGGVGTACTVTVTPLPNQNGGPVTISVIVTDAGTPAPSLTANTTFQVTVTAVDDTPTISAIADQTMNESTSAVVNFTINDVDNVLNCATSVTATSTNITMIPVSGVVFSGTAPNCTATITPYATLNGSSNLNFTVSDGNSTASEPFVVNVTPMNDVPTISAIAAQSTNEDVALGVSFTIQDTDDVLACSGVYLSATSSNGTLLPVGNIVFSGSLPTCTATLTPDVNLNGTSNIVITVTDGTSSATSNFTLTVNAVNDTPVISAIVAQSTVEDTSVPVAFTISDVDSTVTCAGSVVGTSSNQAIIADANILVTGTGGNCTATILPVSNTTGVANITLTLTDAGTPLPALTAAQTFALTVTAVNDAPTISSIADFTMSEDTSSSVIPFTIGDVDSAVTCASIVATSSNTSILPHGNITIGGAFPACTVMVTPLANQYGGPITVTLALTDNGTPMPALTAFEQFDVTVTNVNDVPVISAIADQFTSEETAVVVNFNISDVDNVLTCTSLNVSVASSNSALIPPANVVLSGSLPTCTATITPALNQSGTTTLAFTVNDNGTPNLQAVETFDVTVSAVNDAPVIAAIGAQSVNEDASVVVNFTVTDVDSAIDCSTQISTSSSTPALVAPGNVVFGGTAPACTATITPIADQNGTVNLTFTATDGSLVGANSFVLTVNAVNDAPTIAAIASQTMATNIPSSSISVTADDIDSSLTCSTALTATSADQSVIANSGFAFTGTAPNCSLVITPVASAAGGPVLITVTVTDSGTPLPALTDSTTFNVTVNNPTAPPTISVIGAQSVNEDGSVSVNFTINDPDTTLDCVSSMTAATTSATIMPVSGVVFSGSAPTCSALITPVADRNGAVNLTFTVSDGALTDATTFALTVNPINDAPVISAIGAQSTNEDTAHVINFTVTDIDSTLNCGTSVVATSSNAGLLPVSAVVFAGTAPNCTATVTPVADQNGTSNLTFTVSDGSLTDVDAFTLTVNAINDPPVISVIASQNTNEDNVLPVNFTITDVDSVLNCTTSMNISSSNTAVIPVSGVVFSGSQPTCTATVTPLVNSNGNADLTFTVSDGSLTDTEIFNFSVNPINDLPTISAIADQTIAEDVSTAVLPFTIGDVDSTVSCSTSITVSSSNTALIPVSGVVITGTAPNCNVQVTPLANLSGGPVQITLTLTDAGTPAPNLTVSEVFDVTVNGVNDAPTIGTIVDQTINEDNSTTALPFAIDDADSAVSCLTSVTVSSSNTAVIPVSGVVVGGTAPNCTVTVTPLADRNSVTPIQITLTLTDAGTPAPNISVASTFNVVVTPVNDAPVILAIGPQTTNEDTALPVTFTITDIDNTLNCNTSMTISSSNTAVIPVSGVVFSGSAPNCTATVTPLGNQNGTADLTFTVSDGSLTASALFTQTVTAQNDAPVITAITGQSTNEDTPAPVTFTITDIDSTLNCNTSMTISSSNTALIPVSGVVFSGSAPSCTATVTPDLNQNGATTLTFTVSDGSLTAASAFTMTVNAVNDAPVISTIADQSIAEDSNTGALSFSITDVDNTLNCTSSMTASSSNTAVVPLVGIAFGGAAPACTVTVTPATGMSGHSTISLTVSDGSLTAQEVFDVTVTGVNDAPVISALTPQSTNEDTAIPVNFTINDVDSTLDCNTSMTVSSSNTALVSAGSVVFSGTAPACTATITPAPDQNGTVNLTFTVSDGSLVDADSFVLTVNAINDAPVILAVGSQGTNEDTPVPFTFTISDVDSALDCTTSMSAASTNTGVIPVSGVVFSGALPTCTATVTPLANQSGSSDLTFTVSDGSLTDTDTFTFTVNAVNDAPVMSAIAAQSVNEDNSVAVNFTVNDLDSVLTCTAVNLLTASTVSSIVPVANIVLSGTVPNCTATITPAANAFGVTDITLTINDNATPNLQDSETFTLTVNPVNDAPVIAAIGAQSTNEDVAVPVAFSITDVDSALDCNTSINISSTNPSLASAASIVLSGTAPSCIATITPGADQFGTADLTFTVSDTLLTDADTFTLTVNNIADAPVISAIGAQSTNEDTAIPINFTIDDIDSTLNCNTSMTISSSNTALVSAGGVVFSGSAPNCTATITPGGNLNGTADLTFTVSDGVLVDVSTFTLTVNAINDAPVISPIVAQSTNEDVALPIAFTISDVDNVLDCSTSMTVSSSNTTLVPTLNMALSGSLPACTVTVTPAADLNGVTNLTLTVSDGLLTAASSFAFTVNAINDAPVISVITAQSTNEDTPAPVVFTISDIDSVLNCSTSMSASSSNTTVIPVAGVSFAAGTSPCTATVTPAANQTGTSDLTFTVTDGSLTAASTFTMTVNGVNDAPTITPIANQTINEDTSTTGLPFTIADLDNTLDCSTSMTVSSSNTAIIPVSGVVVTGSGTACTVTVTPLGNMNGGPVQVSLTVADGSGGSAQSTFNVTVNPVNDAPVIAPIADQSTTEDNASAPIAFTITDIDSTVSCGSVTASSSNTTVVPNTNFAFGGTAPNCTVTITPANGQNGGPFQISLTLTDAGTPAPNLTAQATFNFTVNGTNDAPTIGAIADQTINEDTSTAGLAFAINDVDNTLDCSTSMTVSSSNTAVIPVSGIVITGTAPACVVTVTPLAHQNSASPIQISLTVTDTGAPVATAQETFTVTVNAVNDAPTIGNIANQVINEDSATGVLPFTIDDLDSSVSCSTSITVSSSNTAVIPVSGVVIGGTAPNCTVQVTPLASQNSATPIQISVTVTDSGTPAPNLTAQRVFLVTVDAVNDVPTIGTVADQTINEDSATSALAFAINDSDSTIACTSANVTVSSSNTAVIPVSGVVVTGTAPNCFVTVTPLGNQNSATPIQISLTLTDSGTPAPNNSVQSTFNVTVNAVNDVPVITSIGNQTINEDTSTGALPFTISDIDSTVDCSTSITVSSSNTAVIPVSGVVIAGTGTNCTVNVTPLPNANGGPVRISLTLTDAGTPAPNLTAQTTFDVTVNAVNNGPTISTIADQTINEDTPTAGLPLTINDIDSTLNCSTSITVSSSNTAVIPVSGVVITGSAPACTVTVTPLGNQSGGPVTISLTVTDGSLTAQSTFNVTVTPINDAPTISTITNLSINEDNVTAALPFTISDIDSTVSCSTGITVSSSNTAVIPVSGVVIGGTAPNCTATVTPLAGQNGGPTTITLIVTDTGSPMPAMTAMSTFDITVNAVNDAPTITPISNLATNEDTSAVISFDIDDQDSILLCTSANLSAASTNTGLVSAASIVFGGTYPNCTATATPAANANGTTDITITVMDNGAPNLQASRTFTLTVTPINDAPTIGSISDQTINEDSATAALGFSIGDVDSTVACNTSVTASSSDTAIIPVSGVVVTGTAPNCFVTVTPLAGQSGGPTQISLTLTDAGTPAPNLSAQTTFNVTVTGVNDAPTITPIANQTINEDTATSAIPFTITDADSTLACTSANITVSSSNTAVIPVSGVAITGTAPNCFVTVTPLAEQNGGPVQITLLLTDSGTPLPTLSVATTFNVTVNAVNDAPTIGTVADQTINEDTPTSALAFTIGDSDSTVACNTSVTVSSSNTAVIPVSGVVIGGTAPNCTVTVTPLGNQNSATPIQISLTLTDAGTPAPNLTVQSVFNVTVDAVNDAPTIGTVANQTITEDTATAALAFAINDIDSALACNTSVTVSSSNTAVIPVSGVVVGGTAPNCTVQVTPLAGQSGGPINITLIVTDSGTPAPNLTVSSQFTVTVNAVNDAPTITTIADQTINEDTNTGALPFVIDDVDDTLSCSTSMTVSSSNTAVIPVSGVVITGTAPNCDVTVTPLANRNSVTPIQISLTVSDGSLTAQEIFTVTVDAVNDAPVISTVANQTINEDASTTALAFTITDIDSTVSCSTGITVSSSNTAIIPVSGIVVAGTAPNCTVQVTPLGNQNGGPTTISLTVTDTGSPMPALTAQSTFEVTVTGINDAPTIGTIANQTIAEDSATAVIPFAISDVDSTIDCTTNITVSSSNTAVIPVSGVVIGGTAPNCTVQVTPLADRNGGPIQITLALTDAGTPAPNITVNSTFNVTVNAVNDAPVISTMTDLSTNEDTATAALPFTISDIDSMVACNTSVTVSSSNTAVIPVSGVVVTGTAPNCFVTVTPLANQNSATPIQISLTLTDSGTPAPNLTAQTTFNVTVDAVNDVPVITAIANQTINEDGAATGLTFSITDIDSTLNCMSSMTGSSSNTALVQHASITFGGTAPNCTVTVTPDLGTFGTANISLIVTDSGTPAPNLTAMTSFVLTVNPVNDAPTITPIADETINEDTNVVVNFDIADTDDVLLCTSANLTASSSNTTLVPNANIVFGGTYPNCTATITPAANQNGLANITINVIDHGTPSLQASRTFALTVDPVNDAPTIGTVANQTLNEDAATTALPFAIGDIDSTIACNTAVTVSSSNTAVIPVSGVVIGGSFPTCTVTVTPLANQNSATPIQISLTLTDAGTPAPNLTAQSVFTVTVNEVNDAPVITTIANQTINEDAATSALPFTITDIDSTLDCSTSIVASSSNTAVIPVSGVAVTGTAPNCFVTVTPLADRNGGPIQITLALTDSGTPAPNITVNSTFNVTVNAVNDAPTIGTITDLSTNEDTPTAALPFTINDSDSTMACTSANVTVSSSNTAIVPVSGIVVTGTAPNCFVTVTPLGQRNGGPVNITLTLTDSGTGSPGVLTAQTSFQLTVDAVNDVPTISTIANQTINEDAATAVLPFTINDIDSTLDCSTSMTVSSSNTAVIPVSGVVVAGTAPNCTVQVTPLADQNGGPVQISLIVTDTGTPLPALTAMSTFNVTVNAVNDAPTIGTVADQTIDEDTNTGALPFTIDDIDSTLACTSANVTISSSNTAVIPVSGIVVTGTAPNCFVTVTPLANRNSATPIQISLTLIDSGTGLPGLLTAQETFTVTVDAVNDAPVISTVANQTINEDTPTSALGFTITDIDSTVSCSTGITVSSSNTAVIPVSGIVVAGTAPNCTVTVTPLGNQNGGPTTISLTVIDTGIGTGGLLTAQSTFDVTVTAINDAPVIASIANQTINEDAATTALPFTITDVDSTVSCTSGITVSSSSTAIIPVSGIVVAGTAPNCTVTVTPLPNANGGPVNITLTLTDTGTPAPNLTANMQFTVTVNAVNDAPTISTVADLATNEDTPTAALPFTISDSDSTVSCTTGITVSSSNTAVIPVSGIVVAGTAPNCTVTVTPLGNMNGGPVNISLTVTDTGTGIPGVLTAQSTFQVTVNPINDAPVISTVAAQFIGEDTDTGAVGFTITDIDSALNCSSSITVSTSNTAIIPVSGIVVGGTAPNCTVTVTPLHDMVGGPTQISLVVTDGGTPLPTLTAQSVFNVTVSGVNDAPVISAIANQTTNEDTPTAAIPFTITDIDSTLSCTTGVAVSSSNTAIIPVSGIVVTGTAPNCFVTVTPLGNMNGGPVNLTLTLTDTGTPMPALTANTQFTVTVDPVNDAPVMSVIAAQSENEDNNEVVNFTITDIDSTLSCTTSLTGSSSNTNLVSHTSIVFSGTAPNCTATITPVANHNGTADLTFIVTDSGTPMPALTASRLFTQTFVPVNDAPTMDVIANVTINEDANTIVPFVIGDIDSVLLCTSANISKASTNTTLVPLANIVIGGIFPNCTATVTPVANGNGTSDITLTVFDNGTPNLQAAQTFTLTVDAVNDVPTIGTVANQTINEDTPTAALPFTIGDLDSTIACSSANVTVSSSNTAIIPVSGVVITGSYPNCFVTVTPLGNMNGGPTQISLTVTDTGTGTPGLLTAQSTFNVTVTAINDVPVISAIADQHLVEDTLSSAIPFTITDIDSTVSCAGSVVPTSSNLTLINGANMIVSGTAPNCTITLLPLPDQNGQTAVITLTLTDNGMPMPALTATSVFNITAVDPVNDVPTIGTVANQTINEDTSTAALPFTIGDVDSTIVCSSANVTVSSSNTAVIPVSGVVIGGTFPTCTVTVTPLANQNSAAPIQISLTVTDTGTPVPVLTAQSVFTVVVNAVNDAPVISTVANQTINEDAATSALAFTITDIDSTLSCTTGITVSSSNTAIIPVSGVVVAGTAPNCTVTVTPLANLNGGPTQISLTVIDTGTGTPGLLTAQSVFNVTVNAVNDAPSIGSIANQTINEDNSTASLPFTINDLDSTITCANVTASSSNTAIIPVSGVVVTGTYPNCNVVVTPLGNRNGGPTQISLTLTDTGTGTPGNLTAQSVFNVTVTAVNDAPLISTVANQTINEDNSTSALAFTITDIDSTLSCTTGITVSSSNTAIIPVSGIVVAGTAPNCTVTVTPLGNMNGGPTQLTLTVTDTGTGTGGILTAQSVFNVTVTAVNDVPIISTVANQTINEDNSTSALAFTITDIDSTLSCTTGITVSSSNTAIIPVSGIVVAGTAPNCTVTVTPLGNMNGGPTQLTLTVTDTGTGTPGLLTAQSTFNVTVTAVNDAPVISTVANQTINEDNSTSALAFTITDIDSTLSCTTGITVSSSNTAIIPVSGIVVAGTAPNCTVTVTPLGNINGGPTQLTLRVTDTGTGTGGLLTAMSVFNVTVTAVNDVPVISSITNGTTNSDTAAPFTFTISDIDATLACSAANLTAASSNTTMVPVANVVFSGTAPNCTATVTPVANQNGQTQISVTVNDNGNTGTGGALTAQSTFLITVRPKAPTNVTIGASWTQTTSTPSISWTASTSNNKTDYEVGISTSPAGGIATAGWTSIGSTATTYVHNSVPFAECSTYYASVRTKDSVGTLSPDFAFSAGSFRYDGTDPQPPTALTIIGNAKANRGLNLSWTAGSDNCVLMGYDISIGTTAGGVNVLNWTNIGNVTNHQATGLALTAATNYYFNIRTKDASNRASTVVTMGPFNICEAADGAFAAGANTIPVGCYYARAKVWGAGGGRGSQGSRNGGGSGYATADFSVKPGETITANIGGVGGAGNVISGTGPAGANGGGTGKGAFLSATGGGGGGSSNLQRAGTNILVAGGGGGGGDTSLGGAGCDGTSGGGAANTGSNGINNGGGGGGGGVNGGSTSAATGGRGGTCSASYAGGPTGQFGSFNGLVGASTLGGAGVNPANAADGNRGGAGRGQDGTAGTGGLIYIIWP